MRHPCTCTRPKGSGRYYLGTEACLSCGRLVDGTRRARTRKLPEPSPSEPEPIDRETVILIGASIFKARPHLRNIDVYNRLDDELDGMPTLTTWLNNGWAAESRRLSGTKPIAGRPAS